MLLSIAITYAGGSPFGVSSRVTALLHMPPKPTSVLFAMWKAVPFLQVCRSAE